MLDLIPLGCRALIPAVVAGHVVLLHLLQGNIFGAAKFRTSS
jgi:hypothetical protein